MKGLRCHGLRLEEGGALSLGSCPARNRCRNPDNIRCVASGVSDLTTQLTCKTPFVSSSLWGKFGGLDTCRATFLYSVPLPIFFLTRLLSKLILKRKDFRAIVRLPWAQEAPGSNPGAPTKTSRVFSSAH